MRKGAKVKDNFDSVKRALRIGSAIEAAASEFASIFEMKGWTWDRGGREYGTEYCPSKDEIKKVLTDLVESLLLNDRMEFSSTGRLRVEKVWYDEGDDPSIIFCLEIEEVYGG